MPYLIDGYNLLHEVDELSRLMQTDLQGARHRLVRMVEETAHNMARQTAIVFEGRKTGSEPALTSNYLRGLVSRSNL